MTHPDQLPVKPTIPDVAPLVLAYYAIAGNEAGGNFHMVLDNQNISDSCIRFCIDQAKAGNDAQGIELGALLLQMSKTQRLKLASMDRQAEVARQPHRP